MDDTDEVMEITKEDISSARQWWRGEGKVDESKSFAFYSWDKEEPWHSLE